MAIDHVLKLYSISIQSSFLHYGFWDNPSLVDLESMTLQEVKKAQTRYIENLSSFIPEDVKPDSNADSSMYPDSLVSLPINTLCLY